MIVCVCIVGVIIHNSIGKICAIVNSIPPSESKYAVCDTIYLFCETSLLIHCTALIHKLWHNMFVIAFPCARHAILHSLLALLLSIVYFLLFFHTACVLQ